MFMARIYSMRGTHLADVGYSDSWLVPTYKNLFNQTFTIRLEPIFKIARQAGACVCRLTGARRAARFRGR